MVIKPKSLYHGDVIGIISPASPVSEEKIDKAIEILCSQGYRVKLGKSAQREYGYLAGGDQERAADLEHMFLASEVKAIFCLRGGYGSLRLLDKIDYEKIRQYPKIFVGYSDITALHIAIHQSTGLVTFHGPMAAELADRGDDESWHTLQAICSGDRQPCCFQGNESFYTIVPGSAEGELTGGNLSLICSTLGTPFEIDTKDKILFIEEVNEEVYQIDRMLTQLRLAGKLNEAKGIILTDFHLSPRTNKPSLPLKEVIHDLLSPLKIPCFYGLSAGHCLPNITLPIGASVEMDASQGVLHIEESVVS
ncbi:S66 peptidase family protein [Thermoactinomyces mirandus]|uniref:LD-carboxypeptidase n=1 Tax=Thermoactinomyces mirandus TaxID=2756294 RepID=A0A7W2ATC8_9BACL|nr:LD-carboxypeptidase [Thermoactinomyces mirandus]MBA4603620.1 LD-carboxypeptidase [Thermoactinomyces mirandus]